MTTFRFRLDRVMQWRETALKAEEARLEQLRLEAELAQRAIEVADDSLNRASSVNRERVSVTGAELAILDAWAARKARERPILKQRLASADESVETQKRTVAGCRREMRLLERLRDRRRAEWVAGNGREAEILAGEFSVAQWIRARIPTQNDSRR